MENKKNGLIGALTCVIVILMIVITVGYVYFNGNVKGFSKSYDTKEEANKKDDDNKTDKDEKVKLDNDSPLVARLLDKTDAKLVDTYKGDYIVSKLTDKEKWELLSDKLDFLKDGMGSIQLNGDYLYEWFITEDSLKKGYEAEFGPNTYKHVDKFVYSNYNITLKYDKEKMGYYYEENGGRGGTCYAYWKSSVINAIKTSTKIEINTYSIFYCCEGVYNSFNKNDNTFVASVASLKFSDGNVDESSLTAFVNKYKNKLKQVKYTFEIGSDGDYYYSSAEIVK